MAGPLHGVRVIEVATMILGPLATQYLADMGAEVIKIEPPEGDLTRAIGPSRSAGMGAFYLGSNRNKRSVVLDLKQAPGREALARLIADADVVLHSIRAKAASRIGLTYDQVRMANPSIVYCHVKGFSDHGLKAGMPAYDDVSQAASGMAMMLAPLTGEPRFVPSIIGDKVTALHAAMAVLAALHHRQRTGEGQAVDVPMFETMAAFNMVEHLWGETFEPAEGPMGYAPIVAGTRRPFAARDGLYLCVLPYTDGHWRQFCAATGDPSFANDPRFARHAARVENQCEFWREVGLRVAQFDRGELIERLRAADVPYSEVNSFDDLISDPHLESVGLWREMQHPSEGRLKFPRSPIEMSQTPLDAFEGAPRLGADTEDVLRSAGLDDAEIAALRPGAVDEAGS